MPKFESQNLVLIVDDNWLSAYVQFKDFSNSGLIIKELTDLLKSKKITSINKYNLQLALTEKETKKRYLITKGIPPVNGKSEYYKLLIDIDEKPKPVKRDDGSVDFKELIIPNLVRAGQPIMERMPAEPGVAGKDIKGDSIEPQIDSQPSLSPTPDLVSASGNDSVLVAGKSGLLKVEERQVKITTKLFVRGDINFSTGSIHFPGHVTITGDVKSGFSIEADGDVEIVGVVEDAELKVGGNLKIKGGFIGTGNGKIICNETVNVTYAANQSIECKNLVFQKEIVNCTIKAFDSIKSEFGQIIGGNIWAGLTIQVKDIGHEESASANLIIGSGNELLEKKKELEQKIQEYNDRLKTVKEELYILFKKQIKNQLRENESDKLKDLQVFKESAPGEINKLENELTVVNTEYEKIKNAQLVIKGNLTEGTKVEILGVKIPITKTRRKIKILLFDKEIKMITI